MLDITELIGMAAWLVVGGRETHFIIGHKYAYMIFIYMASPAGWELLVLFSATVLDSTGVFLIWYLSTCTKFGYCFMRVGKQARRHTDCYRLWVPKLLN